MHVESLCELRNSVFAFVSTTGKGFQVEYPTLTLHAISRSEEGHMIYCQIDEPYDEDAPNDAYEGYEMRELKRMAGSGTFGEILHVEGHFSNEHSIPVLPPLSRSWRDDPAESPALGRQASADCTQWCVRVFF